MCLGGHKFDLRLYVLVTSFNPLEAWLYEEGFARVATRPFSSDDVSDKFVHLTNASIQRHNATTHELYGPLVGAAEDEAAGTKCTLQYLWKQLAKDRDVVKIREDIDGLILKSLVCAEDRIPHQACAFELFGYDVLLDEDARPWLLEVNASPSMARDTPLDKRVKESLIRDTIRLVDPKPYDRSAVADVFDRRLAATQQAPLARDLGAFADDAKLVRTTFYVMRVATSYAEWEDRDRGRLRRWWRARDASPRLKARDREALAAYLACLEDDDDTRRLGET